MEGHPWYGAIRCKTIRGVEPAMHTRMPCYSQQCDLRSNPLDGIKNPGRHRFHASRLMCLLSAMGVRHVMHAVDACDDLRLIALAELGGQLHAMHVFLSKQRMMCSTYATVLVAFKHNMLEVFHGHGAGSPYTCSTICLPRCSGAIDLVGSACICMHACSICHAST